MVVVEATSHFQTNSIEYVGIPPMFAEINDCEVPPHYNVIVGKIVGVITVKVEKS